MMSSREAQTGNTQPVREYGARGIGVSSPLFFLKHGKDPEPLGRIVIITPKRLFKKAVERNRARRRARAAITSVLGTTGPSFFRITVSVRERAILTLPFEEVKNQLRMLLRRTTSLKLRSARAPENTSMF